MTTPSGALWLITADANGESVTIPFDGVSIVYVDGDTEDQVAQNLVDEDWRSVLHVTKYHSPEAVAVEFGHNDQVVIVGPQPYNTEPS